MPKYHDASIVINIDLSDPTDRSFDQTLFDLRLHINFLLGF